MENRDFSPTTSLTEEISDVVRERILSGEYEIGEKIKENQIATELSVSRTPIREAFKLLENEGLIDYIPNRGCFAKGFTKRDVEDIYAVREALEELAVAWSCERIIPDEIKALEEQCDMMEFYIQKNDVKKVLELNSGFHDLIYASARSRFLAQVLRSYKAYIDKSRKIAAYEQPYLESIIQEHRVILEAIKARDKVRAVAAMKSHLIASQQRAERIWKVK